MILHFQVKTLRHSVACSVEIGTKIIIFRLNDKEEKVTDNRN